MWRCMSLTMSEIDQPKEVLVYDDSDGEIDGRKIVRTIYACPNCGKDYLIPYEFRCPRCEQMLKW